MTWGRTKCSASPHRSNGTRSTPWRGPSPAPRSASGGAGGRRGVCGAAWLGRPRHRGRPPPHRGQPPPLRRGGRLPRRRARPPRPAGAGGKTAILVADGREPLGVVAVADALRPTAAAAVAALRTAGIRRLVMLTGDGRTAADRVAQAVGVAEVRARLLPEEKLAAVRALQQEGEVVAVVGDGVNDAPALAAATVGIAMGVAGTHAALETADVALMGDDLTLLAPTIVRARRTLAIIRQNMALALGLKAVFLLLALLGQATLWMAVAADMGASLLVIANGLRALPAAGRPA
ncbi:MAG: HAD-IC family P-type ATPase [Gemmatimonadetes bacterium]|nr:HAD-IC family P-type ATPase [Gemmatimonadota bacterium]